ncbi:MAG: hypothetical protein ACYDEQ_01870 [Desulfocucumaceae bacterium]
MRKKQNPLIRKSPAATDRAFPTFTAAFILLLTCANALAGEPGRGEGPLP